MAHFCFKGASKIRLRCFIRGEAHTVNCKRHIQALDKEFEIVEQNARLLFIRYC